MSEVRSLNTAETETTKVLPNAAGADNPTNKKPITRLKRALLLFAIPTLVIAGAIYAYLHSGRYVSTENAYVQADIVNVAAEVSGIITAVSVTENQRIEVGTKLFALDTRPFEIALQHAAAELAQAESDIEADRQAYRQAMAELDLHQTTTDFAEAQYHRQQGLREGNLGSVENLDAAKYALDSAKRKIVVAQQQAATLLARLHGNADAPVATHPRYQLAQAEYDKALLDLTHTNVVAPFAGVVKNKPELGAFVERGVPVISIISDQHLWVEANFKETQYEYLRLDQPVEVEVDSYPGFIWHGRIQSISEATGAEFALLPPQNATGNWVKIVQRIPMRITLEPHPDQPPLRVGMSSTVTVDTGHKRVWRDLIPSG